MASWGNKKQLHTLIKQLHHDVRDTDDLSLITGLSIVKSLDAFQLQAADQDVKVQEVNQVYKGLTESLTRTASGKSANSIIHSYNTQIQPTLQDPSKSLAHTPSGSYLLRETLKRLERGHGSYNDQIRKRGHKLVNAVYDLGSVSGSARDVAVHDHYSLEKHFAEGGR